jgi:hypothetical protein
MKHCILIVALCFSCLVSFAGNFFVVTFSETGPMTIEGRHRDYVWIVPADSVKNLVPAAIYPFLLGISKEDIQYVSIIFPYCTFFSYSSELEKIVKNNRKKVTTFKTTIANSLHFKTKVFITPIQGDINKEVLLNSERNTVYYSNSFTLWEEGFDTDEYFYLTYKWFPSVPYRCKSDFLYELY